MDGFEIKTERDTLRRLPRQISAYERLFDRCAVVVAPNHIERALGLVPHHWGVYEVRINGHVEFARHRAPKRNHGHDPETLVRLLWRDEAAVALTGLGVEVPIGATRPWLWQTLLERATLSDLRRVVRRALILRDPASARFGARRLSAVGVPRADR